MARRDSRSLTAPALRKRLGDRIVEAQEEAGIETVEELARRVGLSLRLVQKHRAGDNAPSLANLGKYARVLGKPVAWFFEDEKAAA